MSVSMTDEQFMLEALVQAQRARSRGEVPVGAIVVVEGRIIARGENKSVANNDPTAHAEIIALRKAAGKRGNYRLAECDLFVTLEPCAMCLGAVIQARIKRLIYGAADPKAGAVRSIMKFPFDKVNHRPDIVSGILAEECGRILRGFFEEKR